LCPPSGAASRSELRAICFFVRFRFAFFIPNRPPFSCSDSTSLCPYVFSPPPPCSRSAPPSLLSLCAPRRALALNANLYPPTTERNLTGGSFDPAPFWSDFFPRAFAFSLFRLSALSHRGAILRRVIQFHLPFCLPPLNFPFFPPTKMSLDDSTRFLLSFPPLFSPFWTPSSAVWTDFRYPFNSVLLDVVTPFWVQMCLCLLCSRPFTAPWGRLSAHDVACPFPLGC